MNLRIRPLCTLLLLLLALPSCDGDPPPTPLLPTAAATAAAPELNPDGPLPPTPSPTAPAPPPPPTVTANPAVDSWTLLVYMDADNDLEPAALRDLEELEAAAASPGVTVLVQIDRRADAADGVDDWADTRRLRIVADGGAAGLSSELLASGGEANMGDPATLSAFIAWGVATAPAGRYGLILWDHGAGWFGTTFDQGPDSDGDPVASADRLTMPELATALQRGLEAARLPRLDLIAFDGCLMGQLDVLAAVAPFAHYAVGSQELIPGSGFDYTALLDGLGAAPQQDGAALGRQIVDDFYAYYAQIARNDFITLAVVDLAALAPVVDALEVLTVALQRDPALTAAAVGDARSGAETYARYYREQFERYASIDLWHFAAILARRVPDAQVQAAAERLMSEIEAAVVVARRGAGLRQAQGVAVYFPRAADYLSPNYAAQTTVTAWANFLQSHYRTRSAALTPPAVTIVSSNTMTASVQAPAYLGFELTGKGIVDVTLLAGRVESDGGAWRLLEANPLRPEPLVLADGTLLEGWRDGLHDDFFVWLPEATYLTDGSAGDYVVMWPTHDDQRWAVSGLLLPADNSSPTPAYLVFDTTRRALDAVWAVQEGGQEAAPYELPVGPGDRFQIDDLYLVDGVVERTPGVILALGGGAALSYAWRALPAGTYFAGFEARNEAGQTAAAFTSLAVDNSDLAPGFKAYRDPYLGFQFFYPQEWAAPAYDPLFCATELQVLCAADPDGETWLYLYVYPDLAPGSGAGELQAQTLRDFGDVAVRYEDSLRLAAGGDVLRTAYSYETAEGARTGVFAAFVVDGVGYVVDLDGPAEAETVTVALSTALVESWRRQPAGFGLYPGAWARLDRVGCEVAYPAAYAFRESSGWCIFNGGGGRFLALRADPRLENESVEEILQRWLATTSGQAGFAAAPSRRLVVDGYVWQRVDFTWEADEQSTIGGLIMVAQIDDAWVVAWAEAPAPLLAESERAVFEIMIAEYR